jgi:hypothetical protein
MLTACVATFSLARDRLPNGAGRRFTCLRLRVRGHGCRHNWRVRYAVPAAGIAAVATNWTSRLRYAGHGQAGDARIFLSAGCLSLNNGRVVRSAVLPTSDSFAARRRIAPSSCTGIRRPDDAAQAASTLLGIPSGTSEHSRWRLRGRYFGPDGARPPVRTLSGSGMCGWAWG